MALKIILGSKDLDRCLQGMNYVDDNDDFFNSVYQTSWAEDSFVRNVLDRIDNIERIDGHSFYNRITKDAHSERELSTGCKTIILMYKYPDYIIRARMGENCIPFLEELAQKRDITIHAWFTYFFDFDRIGHVDIVNWDRIFVDNTDLLCFYDEYSAYEKSQ